MKTRKAPTSGTRGDDGTAELLKQYGCGPIEFSGTENALYERHLLFDNGEPIWEPVVDRLLKDNKLVLRDQLISIPEVAPPSSAATGS